MPLSLSQDSARWGLSPPPNSEEPVSLGPLRTALAGLPPLCARGIGPLRDTPPRAKLQVQRPAGQPSRGHREAPEGSSWSHDICQEGPLQHP